MALRCGLRPANLLRLLRLQRYGRGPRPDLWLSFPGKLPLPLPLRQRHGVLAALAYQFGQLVPGLRLYPAGGQPLLPQPVAAERVPCLGPDGPVARGGVEFRAVGPVFRRPAGGGKAVVRPRAGKDPALKAPVYAPPAGGEFRALQCRRPPRRRSADRRPLWLRRAAPPPGGGGSRGPQPGH